MEPHTAVAPGPGFSKSRDKAQPLEFYPPDAVYTFPDGTPYSSFMVQSATNYFPFGPDTLPSSAIPLSWV